MASETIVFKIEVFIPNAENKGIVFKDSLGAGVVGTVEVEFNLDDYDRDPTYAHIVLDEKAREFRDEMITYRFKKL